MLHMPAEFPTDAASVLVTTWRSKSGDKAAVAEAAWNLLGFGLAATLGSPGQASPKILGVTSGHDPDEDVQLSDEEVVGYLESHVNTPSKERVYGAIPLPLKALMGFALKMLAEFVEAKLA